MYNTGMGFKNNKMQSGTTQATDATSQNDSYKTSSTAAQNQIHGNPHHQRFRSQAQAPADNSLHISTNQTNSPSLNGAQLKINLPLRYQKNHGGNNAAVANLKTSQQWKAGANPPEMNKTAMVFPNTYH